MRVGGRRGWKNEERRTEAGEGGSKEIENKSNFMGFYSRAFQGEVRKDRVEGCQVAQEHCSGRAELSNTTEKWEIKD